MTRFDWREHNASILVATLASAFGVALLQGTSNLAIMLQADNVTGSSATVAMMLGIVAMVFIVIAIYVAAVVTANTFATVIVGRTRTIALLRLVGATARSQRRAVATEGLIVGMLGAAIGAVVGTAIPAIGFGVASATGAIPAAPWNYVQPVDRAAAASASCSPRGSRRGWVRAACSSVSPMQATGAAQEHTFEEVTSRRGRNAFADRAVRARHRAARARHPGRTGEPVRRDDRPGRAACCRSPGSCSAPSS